MSNVRLSEVREPKHTQGILSSLHSMDWVYPHYGKQRAWFCLVSVDVCSQACTSSDSHTITYLHTQILHSLHSLLLFFLFLPLRLFSNRLNLWHFHQSFFLCSLSLSLHLHTASLVPPLSHLILMHGCIFGLCRDSLSPGGFSWNQFTLPVPSHWSTIYRPSTAGAAGRLFNRYIRCLTWQSIYSKYSPL